MEILYLIIGLAIGGGCIFFMMQGRLRAADMLLQAEKQAHAQDKNQATQLLDTTKQEAAQLLATAKQEAAKQHELLRAQFTAISEQMLKQRSAELQNTNRAHMEQIFAPLRDNLTRMEQAMKDTQLTSARNTASVEKSIQLMMDQASALGKEADRLSNALQHQNKVAGNWGELVLTELLESQGLQKGVHFDVQETLRDWQGNPLRNEDTGSKMVPDVILHLADNRDVIIDSKVSLKAFTEYQNTDDSEQKQAAASRVVESLKNHVKGLSGKNYSKYITKNRAQIDFVIMFVPIEGALQLALNTESDLWRDAFEKKVFIAGTQTLIAGLRIIDLTWVNVQHERNTQKIIDEARKLIERVERFHARFMTVGKKLRETQEAYDDVKSIVSDGKQTILSAGRAMEQLGVRGKKALPNPDLEDLFSDKAED